MRSRLAALAAAALVAACGGRDDFAAAADPGTLAWGTVAGQRAASVASAVAYHPRYEEHPLAPDPAEELLVRLDDGATVALTLQGPHRYARGERVRLYLHGGSAFVVEVAGFQP